MTLFLEETRGREVLCANLLIDDDETFAQLPLNYTPEDLDKFLDVINEDYDRSRDCAYTEGVIWYKDGSWSELCEEKYHEHLYWNFIERPKIPDYIQNPNPIVETALILEVTDAYLTLVRDNSDLDENQIKDKFNEAFDKLGDVDNFYESLKGPTYDK